MNKRARKMLVEGLIVGIFIVILHLLQVERETFYLGYPVAVTVLPLIVLGLRYGWAFPTVVGIISGALSMLFSQETGVPVTSQLLYFVTPYICSGVAGLFAKYAQKTLNNGQYSSMRLNVITGSLLTVTGYTLLSNLPISIIARYYPTVSFLDGGLWLGIMVTTFIAGGLISVLAQRKPSILIPKRSRYLSRKETSRLLND